MGSCGWTHVQPPSLKACWIKTGRSWGRELSDILRMDQTVLLLLTACSLIGPSRGIHFSHGLSILKPFSSSTCLSSDILVTIFLLLFFSKFIIAQVAQSFPLLPFRATSNVAVAPWLKGWVEEETAQQETLTRDVWVFSSWACQCRLLYPVSETLWKNYTLQKELPKNHNFQNLWTFSSPVFISRHKLSTHKYIKT